MINIYWCQYAEGGPCWVCRLLNQEYWFGTGKNKIEAFLDALRFNKNPNYPYGL